MKLHSYFGRAGTFHPIQNWIPKGSELNIPPTSNNSPQEQGCALRPKFMEHSSGLQKFVRGKRQAGREQKEDGTQTRR